VIGGLDVRHAHQIDAAWVDDDQLGALPQPLFQARPENRVSIRWVGADDDDHIALFDAVEILCAGRGAEGLAETVPRR